MKYSKNEIKRASTFTKIQKIDRKVGWQDMPLLNLKISISFSFTLQSNLLSQISGVHSVLKTFFFSFILSVDSIGIPLDERHRLRTDSASYCSVIPFPLFRFLLLCSINILVLVSSFMFTLLQLMLS